MLVGIKRLPVEMTAQTFGGQPLCTAGNGLAAIATSAAVAASTAPDGRWQWWLALQTVGTLCALWLYLRRAVLLRSPRLARAVLLSLPLGTGLCWGLAAWWWPLHSGDAGLAVLLSIMALMAAATSTWSAVPLGLVFFSVPALAPYSVVAIERWWLWVLIVCILLGFVLVTVRNHRLLKATLILRWSNEALLQRAAREGEIARLAQKKAERAAESKTRFLAAASHDLRQPVQALQLFADLLAQQNPAHRQRETTDALVRTAQALSAMLESLLDLSRLDAGVVSNTPTNHALHPLLYDTAAALSDEADDHDVLVSVAGPDCYIFADPVLVARVVQNLATNALRHAGGGRVLLSTRRRGGRHCLLQVWDQGAGIDEADRGRIFDEFVQLGNTERDRHKGLGLGLSMVRRICDLNRWELSVRSRPGHGTVFGILLPLASESRTTAEVCAPRGRVLNVMLVEDDVELRAALVSWLGQKRCMVHAYREAHEALEAYARSRAAGVVIDVVVTDHGLPGRLNGADLLHALREHEPNLPSVLLTGAVTLPAGARPPTGCLVLIKPVSGARLWTALQEAAGAPALDEES